MTEQVSKSYCRIVANIVGKFGSVYLLDWNRALISEAWLDGALQKVILVSLRACIVYLAQYPVFDGHLGEV